MWGIMEGEQVNGAERDRISRGCDVDDLCIRVGGRCVTEKSGIGFATSTASHVSPADIIILAIEL